MNYLAHCRVIIKENYIAFLDEPKFGLKTPFKLNFKTAYYDLSKKFHPDVNDANDHVALKRFHEITAAYEVLGDAKSRRDYDIRTFGVRGTGGVDEVSY